MSKVKSLLAGAALVVAAATGAQAQNNDETQNTNKKAEIGVTLGGYGANGAFKKIGAGAGVIGLLPVGEELTAVGEIGVSKELFNNDPYDRGDESIRPYVKAGIVANLGNRFQVGPFARVTTGDTYVNKNGVEFPYVHDFKYFKIPKGIQGELGLVLMYNVNDEIALYGEGGFGNFVVNNALSGSGRFGVIKSF